jgi:transmembrane sensor
VQRYLAQKSDHQPGYIVISSPAGSKSEVSLPDGSKVWLNASSEIRFSRNFDTDLREVSLIGEAYFDVANRENKPFVVLAQGIKVNVLGTAFNVRAYPEDKFIETTVERGLVTVERNGESRQRKVMLRHNQQVRFENIPVEANHELTTGIVRDVTDGVSEDSKPNVYFIQNVETYKFTSWIQNILLFESESLASLSELLERRHGVKIEIRDEKLKDRLFTGVFEKESIDQIFKALQYAGKFHYLMDKDQIIVDSKPIKHSTTSPDTMIVRTIP